MYQLSRSKISLLVKKMLCGKSWWIFSARSVSSSIGSVPKARYDVAGMPSWWQ